MLDKIVYVLEEAMFFGGALVVVLCVALVVVSIF